MRIKQLSELLNMDIRRIARQKFGKEFNVCNVHIERAGEDEPQGNCHINVEFEEGSSIKFSYDCHGHLLRIH